MGLITKAGEKTKMTMNEPNMGYAPQPSSGAGKRVVGKSREAPELLVSFQCPRSDCSHSEVLDAYKGVPSCTGAKKPHPPVFMDAMFLVKGARSG
jgi:hypothetical protein